MSFTVASFPSVEEVQQNLPSNDSMIVPLSVGATNGNYNTNYNLQLSAVGSDGFVNLTGVTRPFSVNLKTLGGTFNRELACWKFEAKHESEVRTLMQAITEGKITPEKFNYVGKKFVKKEYTPNFSQTSPQTPSVGFVLPTTGGNGGFKLPNIQTGGGDFQVITYSGVYIPRVGMTANVKVNDKILSYPVVKVGHTGSNVDQAIITTENGQSELVVIKGYWKVNGLLERHTVLFKKN